MRVLVACEFSGVVRDAFIARGHDAVSCDIDPSEGPGPHIQDDVRNHLNKGWNMLIGFPPCTYLSTLNAPLGRYGGPEQKEALAFVLELMNAPIERIAIENPVGAINTRIERPTQIIQPYQFGDPWQKRTCLWLTELPALIPTNVLPGKHPKVVGGYVEPSRTVKTRSKERSRTFPGIARAMAEQWG